MRKGYFYQIKLSKAKDNGMNKNKIDSVIQFDPIVNKAKLSKIYVVKANKEFIYVGKADRGIFKRLGDGLNPKGKRSYGYPWREKINSAGLYVWLYPEFKPDSDDLESLEAELVYLIRKNTGTWPKYQCEIHFHPSTPSIRREAQEIFSFLKSR
ncbi:MAG TPA: hypothetical protein PKL77_08920 [Candidatus Omnitrophota bacterium]|nr:hypothetical protein [Candidatus Omnitrophota bacterium]